MINLTTYISKVLKQVHPDKGITGSALDQTNAIINFIGQDLAEKSVQLTENTRTKKGKTYIPRKTINSRTVHAAVKLVLPGELSTHAVQEGVKARDKYRTSMRATKELPAESKNPMTKAFRAGLIFSPSKTKVGGFFSVYDKYIGADAPVYLAAVLEYLTAEMMELAGNIAGQQKKVRINARHLFLGITSDEELDRLREKYSLTIAGSGVKPEILPELIPTKEQKSKQAYKRAKARREREQESEESGTAVGKKSYRFLPGTKALREIKAHQEDSRCVYLARAPFERLVKDILSDSRSDFRVSKAATNALQYYMESYLIDLLRDANRLAVYNNRQRLSGKDINFVHSLRQE
jgi:histone H2A